MLNEPSLNDKIQLLAKIDIYGRKLAELRKSHLKIISQFINRPIDEVLADFDNYKRIIQQCIQEVFDFRDLLESYFPFPLVVLHPTLNKGYSIDFAAELFGCDVDLMKTIESNLKPRSDYYYIDPEEKEIINRLVQYTYPIVNNLLNNPTPDNWNKYLAVLSLRKGIHSYYSLHLFPDFYDIEERLSNEDDGLSIPAFLLTEPIIYSDEQIQRSLFLFFVNLNGIFLKRHVLRLLSGNKEVAWIGRVSKEPVSRENVRRMLLWVNKLFSEDFDPTTSPYYIEDITTGQSLLN